MVDRLGISRVSISPRIVLGKCHAGAVRSVDPRANRAGRGFPCADQRLPRACMSEKSTAALKKPTAGVRLPIGIRSKYQRPSFIPKRLLSAASFPPPKALVHTGRDRTRKVRSSYNPKRADSVAPFDTVAESPSKLLGPLPLQSAPRLASSRFRRTRCRAVPRLSRPVLRDLPAHQENASTATSTIVPATLNSCLRGWESLPPEREVFRTLVVWQRDSRRLSQSRFPHRTNVRTVGLGRRSRPSL
jgi:hypothetical protein